MNKHLTLLAASALLALSACSNDGDKNTNTMTQAQVDSAVNAGKAQQQAADMHSKDSLAGAMAQRKADSSMTMSGAGQTATQTVAPPVEQRNRTTQHTTRVTTHHSNGNSNGNMNNGNMNNNTTPANPNQQQLTPAQKQEQDNKFNSR